MNAPPSALCCAVMAARDRGGAVGFSPSQRLLNMLPLPRYKKHSTQVLRSCITTKAEEALQPT